MFEDRKQVVEKLKAAGVSFIDEATVYIENTVTVGAGTVIWPNVCLMGNTAIGCDVTIGMGCEISNCTIGNGTQIKHSVLTDSVVGENTTVGPFAYVRPNSNIGNHVKVGDFVEVKNANIGDGTKMSHLTYVGDADVGQRVNFGCGTVIVNYDGKKKYRTVVADDCFIGCNTNLVSPVKVGKNAYTAAGSTITENVPANSLAIARSRQTVKENWRKNDD